MKYGSRKVSWLESCMCTRFEARALPSLRAHSLRRAPRQGRRRRSVPEDTTLFLLPLLTSDFSCVYFSLFSFSKARFFLPLPWLVLKEVSATSTLLYLFFDNTYFLHLYHRDFKKSLGCEYPAATPTLSSYPPDLTAILPSACISHCVLKDSCHLSAFAR